MSRKSKALAFGGNGFAAKIDMRKQNPDSSRTRIAEENPIPGPNQEILENLGDTNMAIGDNNLEREAATTVAGTQAGITTATASAASVAAATAAGTQAGMAAAEAAAAQAAMAGGLLLGVLIDLLLGMSHNDRR